MNSRYKIIFCVFLLMVIIIAGSLYVRHRKTADRVTSAAATSSLAKSASTPATTSASNQSKVTTASAADTASSKTETTPAATVSAAASKPATVDLSQFTDLQSFAVSLSATDTATIAQSLSDQGYIKDINAFENDITTAGISIQPGGYELSQEMTEPQIVSILSGKPGLVWVVIPEGLRKEEIATILQSKLGWTNAQKTEWINVDTATDPDYTEGVYFPETYLIPTTETPAATAKRLIARFNQNFAPYLPQFNAKNIKWTTALTLASIVQREASGDADMPLIAGILWNRLNADMYLDVDSTLQYARGNTGSGYWAPISVADKKIDSPYNTYTNKGLPPHPISDPGLPAIEAVLNPATTDCLYYLHDSHQVTHCSATYDGQLQNIQTYLSN